MADYTRWYRTGSVKVSNGSKIVTGYDTFWLTAGLNTGDIFSLDGVTDYEIDTVSDNSTLTLRTAFKGNTADKVSYSIVRNFTSSMQANIAANTAELLGDFRRYIDADMQSIHGKSAYELAVKNGYAGTESQWLSSLIGAGQWDTLNSRTEILNYSTAGLHNSIFRGKNLGSAFTDAQSAAIKNGTFEDIWLGDFWLINGVRYRIAHIDYFYNTTLWKDDYPDLEWASGETRKWRPHHVLIVPEPYLAYDYYNTEDTKDQPYYTSYYYTVLRPQLISQLENTFGAEHLMEWPSFRNTAWDWSDPQNPKPTARVFELGKCELIHTSHLLGYPAPKYGGKVYVYSGQTSRELRGQFQLFRVAPMYASNPEHLTQNYNTGTANRGWWLQDTSHANNSTPSIVYPFACYSAGEVAFIGSTYYQSKRPVRPFFCLS